MIKLKVWLAVWVLFVQADIFVLPSSCSALFIGLLERGYCNVTHVRVVPVARYTEPV